MKTQNSPDNKSVPKSKKKIKDSIAMSKGYHKIHGLLMKWRRNIYIILFLEVLVSLTFVAFEIYFVINDPAKAFLCWVLIFLVFALVLFMIFESCFLYFIEQNKLRLILYCIGTLDIAIFSFSLAQGIYEKQHENDNLENMNLKISIPISFGIVMLMISVLKVSVYYKIILKADLSNQKNLIKKAILNKNASGNQDKFLQHTFITKKDSEKNQDDDEEDEHDDHNLENPEQLENQEI